MKLTHLGKNNDQILRLAEEPADVLFVQHCHDISPVVRKTLRAFAVQPGNPRRYCLVDGRDSLKLLKAYDLHREAIEYTQKGQRKHKGNWLTSSPHRRGAAVSAVVCHDQRRASLRVWLPKPATRWMPQITTCASRIVVRRRTQILICAARMCCRWTRASGWRCGTRRSRTRASSTGAIAV